MEFLKLPVEVLLVVTQHLTTGELLNLCSLNKRAFQVFQCDEFWFDQVSKTNAFKSSNWKTYMSMQDAYDFTNNGSSCYKYCMKKLDNKQLVDKLIDDIAKWKNGDDDKINEINLNSRLDYVLKNFESFVQFTTLQIMRLSNNEKFHNDPNIRVTIEYFKDLMNKRSKNLQKIDIASTINDLGGDIMFINSYKSIIYGDDNYINNLTLEEVYVMGSLIDPLFHDLLPIRSKVTQNVIKKYKESINQLEENGIINKNENRVHFIMKLFDYEIEQWGKWEDKIPLVDYRDLQNSLILRVYAGLAIPTQLVYNSIILRFCKLLKINNIMMNDIAIGVEENGKCDYLVHTFDGIGSFDETRTDIFGEFPIFADKFKEFQNNEETRNLIDKTSWRRFAFIKIFDSILEMTHFNNFEIKFDGKYINLIQQNCISHQSISFIKIISKNHLCDLRSRILSIVENFKPLVLSGQNCLKLMLKYPKGLNYKPNDPYIPLGNIRLLDSFKYIPNEGYDNETNAKRVNFKHEFDYQIGDLVNAGFLQNALLLDLFLPNDIIINDDMSIEEKTKNLNENGLLLLLNNQTCYVINIMLIEGHSKDENGELMALSDDHIGIWFKNFDFKKKKFIPY